MSDVTSMALSLAIFVLRTPGEGPACRRSRPADAVTASNSGLDPHISPPARTCQVTCVARARGMSEERVRDLVADDTDGSNLLLVGEPRVKVQLLNLALDED